MPDLSGYEEKLQGMRADELMTHIESRLQTLSDRLTRVEAQLAAEQCVRANPDRATALAAKIETGTIPLSDLASFVITEWDRVLRNTDIGIWLGQHDNKVTVGYVGCADEVVKLRDAIERMRRRIFPRIHT